MLNLGFPRVNRGVAILDNTVYVGTLDGYLVALDAKAGIERWSVHVGENPTGHAITAAPLVVGDKVIVGISGGEAGIRGFLDAYDAKTGKQIWRFWTVPSPGEPGSESWPGDSWVHGGGATWLTGSYDPALKLLYWGTGNPGPDWNGDSRKGDNLYTSSLVAHRRRDRQGAMAFPVHAARRPRLGRESDPGARRHADRRAAAVGSWSWPTATVSTTRSIARPANSWSARAYAKQTWAKGLDERGRPIEIPGHGAVGKGTLVYPSLQGSTNWASPSYSPSTGMLYVPVREMGSIYFKTGVEYSRGPTTPAAARSGSTRNRGARCARSTSKTGKLAWDFALPSPPWAGVMSTAGGLVFGGSNEGNFFALDATSGKPLWQFQTGGQIRSRSDVVSRRRQTARRRRRRARHLRLRARLRIRRSTPEPAEPAEHRASASSANSAHQPFVFLEPKRRLNCSARGWPLPPFRRRQRHGSPTAAGRSATRNPPSPPPGC